MTQKILFALTAISLLLWGEGAVAQTTEDSDNQVSISIEQQTFLSFTGLNVSMLMAGNFRKHSLGVGINTSIQNSYFPYQRTNGIIVDYKYYFISNDKIKGFLSLNYNNKNYNPTGRNVSQDNKIHEYVYSNGLLAKIYKGLWIGNSIGFGGYTERYYDISELTYRKNNGFNYRINAIFKYDF